MSNLYVEVLFLSSMQDVFACMGIFVCIWTKDRENRYGTDQQYNQNTTG